jgi:hypothetical protein
MCQATRGLLDSTVPGARGTCVIIFGIVGERGKDLKGKSEAFVTGMRCACDDSFFFFFFFFF